MVEDYYHRYPARTKFKHIYFSQSAYSYVCVCAMKMKIPYSVSAHTMYVLCNPISFLVYEIFMGFISVKFSDLVLFVYFCLNAKNEMNNIHYGHKCEGLTGRTLGFLFGWM